MLSSEQMTYKYPLLLSVAMHVILMAVLLIDIEIHHNPAVFAKGNDKVELIQAVAVNQQKLMEQKVKAKAAQQQAIAEQQQQEALEKQQQAQEQARLKAAAEAEQQAKLKAAAEAQQQATLKAAAEAQQQAKLKAAAEAQQQAKLKAVAEAQQQAKLKAVAEEQQQAKLKAIADAQAKQKAAATAKLKALAAAKQKAAAEAKLKAIAEAKRKAAAEAKLKAIAQAKQKALAAAAAEEAKLQQELATKEVQTAQVQGEVNKYQALIKHAIEQQWIVPPNVNKSLTCKFQIQVAPGGAVINVTLMRSSGDSTLDRSAQTAIYKASPLPVPSDKDAFEVFRSFVVNVKPEEALADS